MGRLQIGAAVLILASTSYAWAQAPTEADAFLGAPMPKPAEVGPGRARPGGLPGGLGGEAARFAKAMGAIQPEGRAATRGALDVKVYQVVSPAVVLVVSDDSLGSGVLVSADGQIVTNLHVVGDADTVGVMFKPKAEGDRLDKKEIRTAKVIRRDEVADLALLKVEPPPGVTPLKIGDSSTVQVGSDVHAVGHPTGEAWTYARGIVSQIRKDYDWNIGDGLARHATVIQTQTPINLGNSGGPLIADDLTVVGINSFKGEGEGLNFAVSGEDVKAFLARDEDRRAAPPPKKKVSTKNCQLEIVGQEAAKKPSGTNFFVDADCDGEADFLIFEPKRKKDPRIWIFDDDGDGEIDTMFFDEDWDDDFEFSTYDTDGNGKIDMVGEFRDGEDEPFRFERVDEE
jgi:S1-C subfamily serine protease